MINTTAPHQFGFRRFLSLINLAAVSAVMLAASGCHKDSFSFDEFNRPTAVTPDDGTGTPGPTTLPVVGIATSETAVIEGGSIALTITSSIDAPTGGLEVIVNIVGAVAADFAPGVCRNPPQCNVVVVIPSESRSVELIITPLNDAAAEGGLENWRATIAPATNIFTVDSNANFAPIAVANVLPMVVDSTNLVALNAYNTPTALAANAMRAGEESADVGDITGVQYNDADGNPRVLVERLQYAQLGIGINGDIADADFDFAHLNENVVPPPTPSSTIAGAAADTMVRAIAFNGINPPTFPTATYALEGEMTYNGNRFYPDGELMADFVNDRIGGEISLDGAEAADDFGGTTFADGTTPITNSDNLTLGLGDVSDAANSGDILDDDLGFSGALNIITAEGFFASLSGTGTYRGRFNDDADYVGGNAATAAPQEISGIFGGITDANNNELKGGFLGQCSADCEPLPIIGVSSSDTTAQEGGDVVLVITSGLPIPADLIDGLAVNINIVGALNGEFTANAEADCSAFPVCTVIIPSDMQMVELTLTPTSDFSTEHLSTDPGESWTPTLVDLGSYDVDATSRNVDLTITDLIAAIGIMTLDTMATEGGAAIALTITSSINAPEGGLEVTVRISGVNANDFAAGVCTNPPQCDVVVLIPTGMMSVVLILTPSALDSVENIERWTAMIVPVNTVFSVDSNADDADFSITDPTFPVAANDRPLSDLNPLDATPTVLGVDEIRDGGDENGTRAEIPITGLRYDDADNNPQIYVQKLTYANLGIWTNGQVPTVISLATATEDDFDNDFRYGFFNDNALLGSRFPDSGQGNYGVEGDATYRGVNFFLEGNFVATFTGSGGSFISNLVAGGGADALDDFGSATARVPDGTNNGRLTDANDVLSLFVSGSIGNDGFTGTTLEVNSTTSGFFRDLYTNFDAPSSRFSGRFYDDSATYDGTIATPDELAGTGVFATPVGMDDLHFGFLGQCFTGCNSFPNIGISSPDSTAQENSGEIVLVIEADANTLADLDVMVQISGTGLMANEFDTTPASACNSLFVCTIRIPSGDMAVSLTLTPIDDSAVETTENWIATVIDGSNYNLDFGSIVVAFDITDSPVPLPAVADSTTLNDLMLYATPVVLASTAIRAGGDNTTNVGTITGLQYNDAAGMPQIYVQRLLGHAHLGIWVSGQVPTVGEFDHDFRYASLADNAVSNLPDNGLAQYNFEADATYKGLNFFPDGNLLFNFGTTEISELPGGNFRGLMTVNGSSADNYFGPGATLPSGGGFPTGADSLRITVSNSGGTIDTADGSFSGTWTVGTAEGFFSDFVVGTTGGTIDGRFYHSPEYVPSPTMRDPFEIAGNGMITDSATMSNDLHFGFIGSCILSNAFCGPGNAQIP